MVTFNMRRPIPNPIPPGQGIKEELKSRGISQKEFAKIIGMQPSHLNELIKGKLTITENLAAKLESALGIPANYWLTLQANYDYDLAAEKYGFAFSGGVLNDPAVEYGGENGRAYTRGFEDGKLFERSRITALLEKEGISQEIIDKVSNT